MELRQSLSRYAAQNEKSVNWHGKSRTSSNGGEFDTAANAAQKSTALHFMNAPDALVGSAKHGKIGYLSVVAFLEGSRNCLSSIARIPGRDIQQ
jgi:hypothetical protein